MWKLACCCSSNYCYVIHDIDLIVYTCSIQICWIFHYLNTLRKRNSLKCWSHIEYATVNCFVRIICTIWIKLKSQVSCKRTAVVNLSWSKCNSSCSSFCTWKWKRYKISLTCFRYTCINVNWNTFTTWSSNKFGSWNCFINYNTFNSIFVISRLFFYRFLYRSTII